jgi:DNA (cytosine-5)-methyltransferase 1
MTGFSAISLFAGCGGSDLGLRGAGIDVTWANEKNESACQFYQAVTGSSVIEHADVAAIDKFKKADILVGCYPCQGYSQGGLRESNASINYLYRHFDRALRQVRPLGFIVENVDGMRFSQNSALLKNQITRFRMAGYRVSWNVLNALDFGVAQNRKRLFIVGIRSSEPAAFAFPAPTHGPFAKKTHRTQKDVIWRYRHETDNTYNDEPFHWYYLSRNRRHEWTEPAPTVVARDRHVALHPDSPPLRRIHTDRWEFDGDAKHARRLSYLECAALQGFPGPKKFGFQSLPLRYRAIGNAVPPPLFAAVAKQLVATLEGCF